MLSKIKSSTLAETRSSISHTSNPSDNEDELDNDTNNNNNNSRTYNNQQQGKKTQDELLDIVEVSRKRRLSKDSADSLTGFIKWSFSHVDPSIHRLSDSSYTSKRVDKNNQDKLGQDEDMLDDEDDWSLINQQQFINNNNNNSNNINNNNSRFQVPDQMLRQHGKLSGASSGGGSSAANLALIKNERRMSPNSLFEEHPTRASKRSRTQVYTPESRSSSTNNPARKTSSYLGNVVDRLHQQQQQQQQQQQRQQQPPAQQDQQQDIDLETTSNAGLSFHLQQFLQQQTSLEDLCSSVGLDDSNQLVLAAAIHRALVDSVGPTSQTGSGGGSGGTSVLANDSKSSTSSIGSSSGSGTSNNNNNNINSNNLNNQTMNASGANLDIVDPVVNRQRRAYNTRAALHGLTAAATTTTTSGPHSVTSSSNNNNISRQNTVSAMNMSNRVQQQRHAQAAAALSALASAGNHSISNAAQPIVDFECDTCGSSFDDRHRLMQHQSIHLELKKNWFTETPVDEVMKIFNRRRGEFLCNTCNLRFEATFDYDKHNHSIHGQRPYCCQFCGNGTRTFRFWRQYLNHLYDHRYIFSCTIDDCDFRVNRRDSLRFHIFRFHLDCQLPQNQFQSLRSSHNMLLGSNNCDSKWPTSEDDDGNDMNVGE